MYKKMINFIVVKCPALYGHCVPQQFENYLHAEHYPVTDHFSFLSPTFSDAEVPPPMGFLYCNSLFIKRKKM